MDGTAYGIVLFMYKYKEDQEDFHWGQGTFQRNAYFHDDCKLRMFCLLGMELAAIAVECCLGTIIIGSLCDYMSTIHLFVIYQTCFSFYYVWIRSDWTHSLFCDGPGKL